MLATLIIRLRIALGIKNSQKIVIALMLSKNAFTEPAAQKAGQSHDSCSFHKNMVHNVPRLPPVLGDG